MAEVTLTIRCDGGPMPAGVLEAMLAEQGARAVRTSPGEIERRGIDWSADVQSAVTTLVVTGTTVAIKAAVDRFRARLPKARFDLEDEPAEPDDGGFLS